MKKMVLLFLICVMVFADANTRATISGNVQFEDLDGKAHDLYDLLNEGKYLFLHSTHSG